MIKRCTLFGLLLILAAPSEAAEDASKSSKKGKAEKKSSARQELSVVTGCLDERPGPSYLLREEGTLKTIAELQPGSYPIEGFAKFLGQKVTVRGRWEGTGDKPALQVRSIERLSDDCTGPPQ
jgi:hypothetical protein